MSRHGQAGLLGLVLALIPSALGADERYVVRSFIQPDQEITETQTIRLVVQVEGQGNPNLGSPRVGKLTNLRIVAGPDTRVNSTWRNGSFTSTSQFVYTLVPERSGAAEVPRISIEIDGTVYGTDPIRFDVAKSEGGTPPRRTPPQVRRGNDPADVFLRAKIGAPEVWVGEPVLLSVSLYAAQRISGASFGQEPALSNFWVEDVEVDPDAEAYQTNVSGRRYLVYPVKRRILVPQTPGDFEIEPYSMQLQVRQRSGDPFDLFTFGRGRTIVRKSQPLNLRVKALPGEGRPDDFSGAVGSYKLQVAIDRTEAAVNDAVGLTASVEGEGSLRAATPPRLESSPDLKVFDPKVTSSFRNVRGKMVSRKNWEWIVVPLTPGEMELPKLEFHYFDPAQGEYRTASQQPELLAVRRDDQPDRAPTARGDVRLQRRDLAFIKPLRGSLQERAVRVHQRGSYLLLLAAPLAWVPLVVLVGRHRAHLQQNLGLARARRARGRARKRLRTAEKHLEGAGSAEFHEEVARALVGYVADRFNRSSAGLTYDLADELLATKGVDPDLRRRFRSCLESCDFARFVPASGDSQRRVEILGEASDLMERLEKAR